MQMCEQVEVFAEQICHESTLEFTEFSLEEHHRKMMIAF
jgi:hypothetical protein